MRAESQQQEAVFPFDMIVIIKLNGELIVKNCPGFLKRYPMLLDILFGFDGIPFEA